MLLGKLWKQAMDKEMKGVRLRDRPRHTGRPIKKEREKRGLNWTDVKERDMDE